VNCEELGIGRNKAEIEVQGEDIPASKKKEVSKHL